MVYTKISSGGTRKMRRKIMENLKKWSLEVKNRMPLLLYGARQVGKTYAMQELGSNEFKNTI